LIVPTFLLALLTFVWITGTPQIGSTTVEEVQTFTLDTWEFSSDYKEDQILCSSEVELKPYSEAVPLHYSGKRWVRFNVSEDRVNAVGPGSCAVVQKVEKTVVEVYSIEVVL